MEASNLVSLMLALSLTACSSRAAAPEPVLDAEAAPKSLLVEMRVTAKTIWVRGVSLGYGPADVTSGYQDDFFVEALDRERVAVNRVALANPLVMRVYNEPGPNVPPHSSVTAAEQTVFVAIPFHPALFSLRMGFTGTPNVVAFNPRPAIREFCRKQLLDGDCNKWLAASRRGE